MTPHVRASQARTYFRHKARGCSGSLSAGPREATSAKGQASSIMKAASSSRMGKSVSVMTAIWGGRLRSFQKHRHQGLSPPDSSCGSRPGAGAGPAPARVLCSHKWLGEASSSDVLPRATRSPTSPFHPKVIPEGQLRNGVGSSLLGSTALCPGAHALRQPRSCDLCDMKVLSWH